VDAYVTNSTTTTDAKLTQNAKRPPRRGKLSPPGDDRLKPKHQLLTTKSKGIKMPQTHPQPPKPKDPAKIARKQLLRDRAEVRDAVQKLRKPETPKEAREAAIRTLADTVCYPVKLHADDEGRELLAKLVPKLLDNGSVGLSGIESAIQSESELLGIPASEVASIPAAVKQRLDKLV
jgi:hypothetical protein